MRCIPLYPDRFPIAIALQGCRLCSATRSTASATWPEVGTHTRGLAATQHHWLPQMVSTCPHEPTACAPDCCRGHQPPSDCGRGASCSGRSRRPSRCIPRHRRSGASGRAGCGGSDQGLDFTAGPAGQDGSAVEGEALARGNDHCHSAPSPGKCVNITTIFVACRSRTTSATGHAWSRAHPRAPARASPRAGRARPSWPSLRIQGRRCARWPEQVHCCNLNERGRA